GCLMALDDLAADMTPRTILDLGCGSGVLAIAAAKLWPAANVVASDNDPVAVAIARDNAVLNAASMACHLSEGIDAEALQDAAPYDLIVANILMQPLIDLAPAVASVLAPGGRVVLSGLLDEQKTAVAAAY